MLNADNQWQMGMDWYEVCYTGHWRWGLNRDYYDGPMSNFSVGPFHFNWRDWNRKIDV